MVKTLLIVWASFIALTFLILFFSVNKKTDKSTTAHYEKPNKDGN